MTEKLRSIASSPASGSVRPILGLGRYLHIIEVATRFAPTMKNQPIGGLTVATVLVADDDRASRELLSMLLRHAGHARIQVTPVLSAGDAP